MRRWLDHASRGRIGFGRMTTADYQVDMEPVPEEVIRRYELRDEREWCDGARLTGDSSHASTLVSILIHSCSSAAQSSTERSVVSIRPIVG